MSARRSAQEMQPWANAMVRMGARACVVSQLTGLPAPTTRKLWIELTGDSSPSGQQPNDLMWYVRNDTRRFHSALIVMLFNRARRSLPEHAALTHAYYHYAQLTGAREHASGWTPSRSESSAFRPSERDYEIPFSRAHYLVKVYTDEMLSGARRKCPLVIRRCVKCGAPFMSHDTEAGPHRCPLCST